jgi:hypothetical protein
VTPEPKARRYVLNDSTVEKLGELPEKINEALSIDNRKDNHLTKSELKALISVKADRKEGVLDHLINIGEIIKYEIPANERGSKRRTEAYQLANYNNGAREY